MKKICIYRSSFS